MTMQNRVTRFLRELTPDGETVCAVALDLRGRAALGLGAAKRGDADQVLEHVSMAALYCYQLAEQFGADLEALIDERICEMRDAQQRLGARIAITPDYLRLRATELRSVAASQSEDPRAWSSQGSLAAADLAEAYEQAAELVAHEQGNLAAARALSTAQEDSP